MTGELTTARSRVLAQLGRPTCLHCGKPIPAWRVNKKGSKFCKDRCGHDEAQKVYADLRWCDHCHQWHSNDCLRREPKCWRGGERDCAWRSTRSGRA